MFRLACIFFSLALLTAFAQNAVVSGRVSDSSQAVVQGATVKITNTRTNIVNQTTTNAEGYFGLPPLSPGEYSLTASSAGFKESRVDAIVLEIGQQRVIPVTLQPGDLKESITISEDAPLLVVNRADRGTVVENQFVKSIPLNTRNPLFLLNLTPGVTTGRLAGDNTASQSTTNNFRINGGRGGTNEILIDGAANTGTYNNQVSAIPQVDAVQEFKVNTSPYAPEFGRTGGGLISFAIKSGTNQLHGSAHEFLRNSVLDSNGFNANRALQPRRNFRRNQFGGTVGGPIALPKIYDGRSRSFFFFAYEGLRERSLNAYTGTVPSEFERRGDFSRSLEPNGNLIRIFDPHTTQLDPNRPAGTTRYIRDLFPGNAVPSALLGAYAKSILGYYPLANQAGQGLSNTNNYFISSANALDSDRYDFRIDHQVSQNHSVFFRWNWFRNINAQPLVYGNFASPVETPNRIPGINWVGNHTWSVSAGTIFQHHFSMAQSETNRTPLSLDFDQATLGLPDNAITGQRVKYFPTTSIGRLTQVGVTGTGYNAVRSRTWQYNANVTILRGSHTIKAGFDWRWFPVIIDQSSPLGVSASGTFTAGPNPQAAAAGTGHGLADLFLNAASGISYTLRPLEDHRHPYYAFYVQDEWRLGTRLTLTYGMRYNLELPRSEVNNEYVFLDLDSPSPLAQTVPGFGNLKGGIGFVGVNGVGNRTQLADTDNWDPRIGLAWQINAKTVVRSGFGIFHHPLVPNTDGSQGFSRTTSALTTQPDGVTPTYALTNPFPQGILQPEGNAQGLMTSAGLGISGPIRQQRLPYQSQWSFDVQRQLPWSLVLDIGYAGTAAVALPSGVQYNQIPDELLSLGTALNQTVSNPFFSYITDPSSTLSRSTVQRGQLLRPYPHFTGMTGNQVPSGHSTYHGMQVRVERRYSSGLAVLFAYTKSKTIDNTGDFGGFLGTTGFNSSNCFSCDRSLSYQHIPDVARLSFRYDLPFGLGKKYLNHGWQARVLGGWAIGSFINWDNGLPISVTGPNDSNSFGGSQRPNATGQKASLDTREYVDGALYFNPAAFARAPQFTFGTASRTVPDVRSPSNFGWDALIEKRFAITERVGVDFRTELFNTTNSVVFGGPNTTVTSADFGRIRLSQVNLPRQIQFGLRLNF